MARQLLAVGLDAGTSLKDVQAIRDQLGERYPDLEVIVIAGCTDLAVVDLPEQSS